MTYSRGQYDDGYGRDRRLAVMRPEYGERRAGSGSSRYSRSSERYARHASDNRNEGRTARSQSRTDRKRRDDAQQARRRPGRMAGAIPLVMPRGRQRVQGNATACVTLHMIVATSVVAGSVTREAGKRAMPMRVRVQVSATSPRPTSTAGIATSASLASSGRFRESAELRQGPACQTGRSTSPPRGRRHCRRSGCRHHRSLRSLRRYGQRIRGREGGHRSATVATHRAPDLQ